MEHANAFGGFLKRLALILGERDERLVHLLGGDHQIGELFGRKTVKARGVFEHRSVAALLHILNDRLGTAGDLRIDARVDRYEGTELLLKVCICRRQTTNLHD